MVGFVLIQDIQVSNRLVLDQACVFHDELSWNRKSVDLFRMDRALDAQRSVLEVELFLPAA